MQSAVQSSITQSAIGLVTGTLLEVLMPEPSEASSTSNQALETAVQVGLNGLAIMTVNRYMSSRDPTGGFLFVVSLFAPQNSLRARFASMSDEIKMQIHPVLSQMVEHA